MLEGGGFYENAVGFFVTYSSACDGTAHQRAQPIGRYVTDANEEIRCPPGDSERRMTSYCSDRGDRTEVDSCWASGMTKRAKTEVKP